MFEEEGMKQIFMGTFKILTEIGYGGIKEDVVKKLKIEPFFRNRLTDNANFEKIQTFNNYVQNLVQLFTFPIAIMMIDVSRAGEVLSLWYEIDSEMIKDPEVYKQLLEDYVNKIVGVNQNNPQPVVPTE